MLRFDTAGCMIASDELAVESWSEQYGWEGCACLWIDIWSDYLGAVGRYLQCCLHCVGCDVSWWCIVLDLANSIGVFILQKRLSGKFFILLVVGSGDLLIVGEDLHTS